MVLLLRYLCQLHVEVFGYNVCHPLEKDSTKGMQLIFSQGLYNHLILGGRYFLHLLEPLHLTIMEGFGCPDDPRSYVVGDYLPLVGSPKANWS